MVVPDSSSDDEFAFVQFMDCIGSLVFVGETIACACSRCSTEDEHDLARSLKTSKRKERLPAST